MDMKRKFKVKNLIILFIILLVGSVLIFYLTKDKADLSNKKPNEEERQEEITDFKGLSLASVDEYVKKKNLTLKIDYDYNEEIEKDKVIDFKLNDNNLDIVVSLGSMPIELFKEKKVNDLGKVPIMMYHGIVNTTENKYTGGNVDKDGYNRTSQAFKEDLEFYYEQGYRMVRLIDYIKGDIKVELGYSPIILTFDDGNANNFQVIGKNEDGSLKFDPKSAIGILEEFKKNHPDMNVTATFFLNSGLCNQPEYNEEIMKWLVDNGYDVGNHTTNHANFSSISQSKTQEVVGKMYQKFDEIIPDKYVKIIALPFGSPYKKSHSNYPYILKGEYNGYSYETIGALRVGWESEVSPFSQDFDPTFLKRCRAYDNNGVEFDIEMNFKLLKANRFISDGNKDYITIPKDLENKVQETSLKIITY